MINVLLVDDEQYSLQGMQRIIPWKRWNCAIAGVATDARRALEIIDSTAVDLVFTDIRMPEMDGLDFIRRARDSHPQIRFVIVSGHGEFEYARRAMQYGVSDFLLKPVGVHEIEEVLMRVTETLGVDAGSGRATTRLLEPGGDTHVEIEPFVERVLQTVTRKEWGDVGSILLDLFARIADAGGDLEHVRACSIRMLSALVERRVIFANESTLMLAGRIGSADTQSAIYTILKEQILLTQNRVRDDTRDLMNPHVQKILVHLLTHYGDRRLTLRWLSENLVYMNPDYLGKLFLQETGHSFSAHLAEYRIARACEILRSNSSISVRDLACRVGYDENVSYFIQQFKKLRGMTPAAYASQAVVDD